MNKSDQDTLSRQYQARFAESADYRDGVWQQILRHFLQAHIGVDKTVLDLGCGWGEFSRNVQARKRYAMDLNPDAAQFLGEGVEFLQQDCSADWPLANDSVDVVFSSNFLEHLPDKAAIDQTLAHARRVIKPGGRIICMGPNIKAVPGAYWDYWDHYVPITEQSMAEALQLAGFEPKQVIDRFLPYTMSDGRQVPALFIAAYLHLRPAWKLLGKQFLVIADA